MYSFQSCRFPFYWVIVVFIFIFFLLPGKKTLYTKEMGSFSAGHLLYALGHTLPGTVL